jgi:hypothetical protein
VAVQFDHIPHGDAGQIGVGLEIILAPVEDFLQQLMPGCLGVMASGSLTVRMWPGRNACM